MLSLDVDLSTCSTVSYPDEDSPEFTCSDFWGDLMVIPYSDIPKSTIKRWEAGKVASTYERQTLVHRIADVIVDPQKEAYKKYLRCVKY